MIAETKKALTIENRLLKWIYIATMILMTISGFGQMPIFKRYYIADIPGMGWTAKFYVTHYIHYICAIILLGLFAYLIMEYFLKDKKNFKLTTHAYLKITLLCGLVVSGVLKVISNLSGVTFKQVTLIILDMAHISLTFLFLILALIFLIMGKKWFKAREL